METMTHDLREVLAHAEKAQAPENFSEAKGKAGVEIAGEYRKAGFKKVADDIEFNMNKKLKLARIAEFEYKVLKKEHFQKWLDSLEFSQAEIRPDRLGNISLAGISGLVSMNMFNTQISNMWLEQRSGFYEQSVSVFPGRISLGPEMSGTTVAQRTKTVWIDGRNFSINIEEIQVEGYKAVPPPEVVTKLNEDRLR